MQSVRAFLDKSTKYTFPYKHQWKIDAAFTINTVHYTTSQPKPCNNTVLRVVWGEEEEEGVRVRSLPPPPFQKTKTKVI